MNKPVDIQILIKDMYLIEDFEEFEECFNNFVHSGLTFSKFSKDTHFLGKNNYFHIAKRIVEISITNGFSNIEGYMINIMFSLLKDYAKSFNGVLPVNKFDISTIMRKGIYFITQCPSQGIKWILITYVRSGVCFFKEVDDNFNVLPDAKEDFAPINSPLIMYASRIFPDVNVKKLYFKPNKK